MEEINAGWYYSLDHGQSCQVIETQILWGETTCRIWLPGWDSVVRISVSRLKHLESAAIGSPDKISYIAAAARVADALQGPCDDGFTLLLSPIESSVILLGLNLQFCHVVINYDIPWNPMRPDQRIGRVNCISQTHTVRAVNFVFEGSVERRILDVLDQKLVVIFKEFGIDKAGDVLDSAQAGHMFNEMYVEYILNPEKIEESVDKVVSQLKEQACEARTTATFLGFSGTLKPCEVQRLLAHPLPYWVEDMTVSYLRAHGGLADKRSQAWNLTWLDGKMYENVIFTGKEAVKCPASRHFTLEEPRIRELSLRLPRFVPGQPITAVSLLGLPEEIRGIWSLWQITIVTLMQEHRSRIKREQEKANYAFAARRKTINRIGLPQVCNYRLNQLLQDERNFLNRLDQRVHVYPEIVPLLALRVEVGVHG